MEQQAILIVDDEEDIRQILAFNLEQAGYVCMQAADGKEALARLEQHAFALLLLDIMMPNMSGFEVAERLQTQMAGRRAQDIPSIIFLTALGDEDNVLQGFHLGADDYISKPFSVKEVLARVRAVLKRNAAFTASTQEKGTHIALDAATKSATLDSKPLDVTKMEYELLSFLIKHPYIVYSREDLLNEVWPDDGLVLERTVDVTINRLRKKLGAYKDRIGTKNGYGYYWKE